MNPQRKSPRLRGYDYTQSGAHSVTVCTRERLPLFGHVVGGEMVLNSAGQIASEELSQIPVYWHDHVALDLFVVMPNHIHAILLLVGTPFLASAPSALADAQKRIPTLGQVVGSYKSGVTRRIRQMFNDEERRVWQGRYHDHIIRNEPDLNRIREYVIYNPARWQEDRFFI